MKMEEIDPKTGMKIRKLAELKPTTAQEYQESMLKRVDTFSQKRESSFNSFVENTIVNGLKTILDLKVKVDEALGENKDKVHGIVEKLLLFGL
jgi:DNA anti-recombination protein RmuC